jgi:Protein of unknown function (DUF2721)
VAKNNKPSFQKLLRATNNQQQPTTMELTIQTPALLFPAVSLLLIAYTNKFLAIASLIRKLITDYEKKKKRDVLKQIHSLRRRLWLIRWMQVFAVTSILICVITMFFIYQGWQVWAKILFAFSLILMMASLVITILETVLSAGALKVLLRDLEETEKK